MSKSHCCYWRCLISLIRPKNVGAKRKKTKKLSDTNVCVNACIGPTLPQFRLLCVHFLGEKLVFLHCSRWSAHRALDSRDGHHAAGDLGRQAAQRRVFGGIQTVHTQTSRHGWQKRDHPQAWNASAYILKPRFVLSNSKTRSRHFGWYCDPSLPNPK